MNEKGRIWLTIGVLIIIGIAVLLIAQPWQRPQPTRPPEVTQQPPPPPAEPQPPPSPPPGPTPPPTETVTPGEQPTPPPEPPQVLPPVPVGLFNELVFVQEPDQAKALDMLTAGQIDLYAFGIRDPELARKVKASPVLGYETSYGGSVELTLNPVGPTFKTGVLNPFSVPAIREALNWLIDRKTIAEEIYGGLAVPRYLPINTVFPDYARLAHVAKELEAYYAHNPDKARAVITQEMQKLGAELRDGKWHYNNQPVKLIFIIRTEDKRREVGDYISNLLEDLGFLVDRQYKTAAEASPIWIGSDPADGKWHLYTAGWVSTVVNRDLASNFDFYYTPRGRPDPLWQAYKPDPEFDTVAERLGRRDYKTIEERQELMERALRLALKDSVRVWLADTIDIWARRAEVRLASDLAGGMSGSALWPFTLRVEGRQTERLVWAAPSLMTEPWNPVAGTNWIFDTMIIRATVDADTLPDPFTGLYWPQRVKSVDVYVQEGIPVTKTHDWLTLQFLPEIRVPEDAWADWDPTTQRFITVGEKYPEGVTAKTKAVVYYPENLFQMKWHDGSRISLADCVLGFILTFERAKPESPIYDEAAVSAFESFMRHFRGLKIVQKDPLVVEVYSDLFYPDAEWIASSRAGYLFTTVPLQTLAIGILAEQNKELAFSAAKSDKLKVERANYIAGPALAILEKYRSQAFEQGYIPYENTLKEFITPEEAKERYRLLGEWYNTHKHFWVGNGPFYLDAVYPIEKNVVIKRFADFPDPPDKWLRFSEPRIAEVEVSGPIEVRLGSAAEFNVEVTFKGEPYAIKDIDFVKFLVFDATGQLKLVGEAQAVRDGLWKVALSPDQTAQLSAGGNRLQVIVVSKLVSIPSTEETTFVTVQ
ncbi:MAG: ABC transporter substrate-binding protein [Candidatus Bipolaricaulota bacterium]|nr:ABC transporter substrate-binding protein [Candidatus Bipolaricaulota bacterium]MDW8031765.1 ABC transporter substrate-binding protein [Candidatus Bipolaricaulota bacterium]